MNKLTLMAELYHKPAYFEPSECVVEKIIPLHHEKFQELTEKPLNDQDFISENRMSMYCDENEVNHCLLVYDEQGGNGLLINAEGYNYARNSAFIPHAKEMIKQYRLRESGLHTVKAPITEKEKSLLDVISKAANRMAQYAHRGKKELYFEDVLNDIGYDLDEIKDMIIHAAAQKLSTKEDISAVEVNELDIPLQPELIVIPKDEHNAEEEIGAFSY